LGWLAAALLILTIPAKVQAQYEYTTNSDNTITITGYTGTSTVVSIPSTISILTVTSIGNQAFENSHNITSVTIPTSVTNIDDGSVNDLILTGAFSFCGSLTNVIFGNGVSNIGDYSFAECSSLRQITIGNSVTRIGNGVFMDCSLTSITMPNSVTSIGGVNDSTSSMYGVFAGCTNLTNVVLGTSLTYIGNEAFYGCASLSSITMPNSVTNIGDWAFAYCTPLHNISLSTNLTCIGVAAFYGCNSLNSITIPDSVTSIRDGSVIGLSPCGLFTYCTNLTNVFIGSGVTNIGDFAFADCTRLSNVTIGDSVKRVGSNVFAGCSALSSITFPNSVSNIGDHGLAGCTNLTSVYFLGNAPSVNGIAVFEADSKATIYYVPGTTGWSTNFDGLPTSAMRSLKIQTNGNGTVTGNTNAYGWYAGGTVITLTANPSPYYSFINWTGTGLTASATNLNLTVTMTQNKTITANFAIDQFKLVVVSGQSGCVPARGTNTLNYGIISCSVTNSPKTLSGSTQYICTGWTGTGDVTSGSGTNTSFTLDQNSSITWLWPITNYWLSVATNGNGSVNVASQWCPSGSNVVITATPSTFNWFVGWNGQTNGCIITSNTLTAVMNATRAITATFNGDQVSDVKFGVQSNRFGFNISGTSNLVIEVEACTNLATPVWIPVGTNKLTNGTSYFSDSKWTNYSARFYRLIDQ